MNNSSKSDNSFYSKFSFEILKSERLRSLAIFITFGFFLLMLLIPFLFFPEQIKKIIGEDLPYYALIGLSSLIFYEIIIWFLLGLAIRRNFTPPSIPRYINMFIETSFPVIPLFVLPGIIEPYLVLVNPVIWFYFIFIILSILRLDLKMSILTGIIACIEYVTLGLLIINGPHFPGGPDFIADPQAIISKGIILLIAGCGAGFVALQVKKRVLNTFQVIEERNNVVNMFGQHVSPTVVDKLLNQKKEIESEIRSVCIMFLDIRNFTNFSEHKGPDEVFSYLNRLFEFMIDIINKNNGIINKFLGDGFMAVFGAPITDGKDSVNAVKASLEIVDTVNEYVNQGKIDPTRVGIGLHTGEAVTGNIGSSQRKEFTIIGDVVNLASRIESLNKQFGSQVLISGEVCKKIGNTIKAKKSHGPQKVKGRQEPVEIFQLA